jgi:hypothetical protein
VIGSYPDFSSSPLIIIDLLIFFFSLALQPPWVLASDFQFHDHFTDGRISWTRHQLVARHLPKHRTTQTQNKHIHIPNIHAMCGIRTHDPGLQASLTPFATVTGSVLINVANNTMLRNPPTHKENKHRTVDLNPTGQLQKHPGATFYKDLLLVLFQFNF